MRSAIVVVVLIIWAVPCWSQLGLDIDGDGAISGNMTANTLTSSGAVINGAENDGTIAGLEVLSGSQRLLMDGNEIDSNVGLHFNFNSGNDVLFRTSTRRADITMVHANGSGTSSGVTIEHPGANDAYWTLYSTNGDGALELYYRGTFRGEFNSVTGNYASLSDGRLKQGVQPLEGILERVALLNPSSYSFRSDTTNQAALGFIAQEVEPLFPELVSRGKVGDSQDEVYMLDTSGFAVIAIAAIQEMLELGKTENARLRAENAAMQQQISSLAQRLDELENR